MNGDWSVNLPDGSVRVDKYVANEYGNLLHVKIHKPQSYAAPAYNAPAYAAPSYAAPAYNAPSYAAPTYKVPAKTHYNYEEKNIYVAPTYSAPAYAAPMPTY